MTRLYQGELMTYQQAGRIAVLKRLAGWVIFIPALISTLVSVLTTEAQKAEVEAYIEKSAPFAKPVLLKLRKLIFQACPEAR